jgi:demethylmenaquinone methyltransferase/2-methoxy-6-polyprenyl-1,4-benzoquinol methylase
MVALVVAQKASVPFFPGLRGGNRFLQADARYRQKKVPPRLPFADGIFQIVSVAFGLRNVSDADKALEEMVRVCRPGGRVAVLEFSTPRYWLLKRLYNWYFQHLLPMIGQSLACNTQKAYNYLPLSVAQFPQGEALVVRMLAAGLEQVSIHPFTFGIATLYVGEKKS